MNMEDTKEFTTNHTNTHEQGKIGLDLLKKLFMREWNEYRRNEGIYHEPHEHSRTRKNRFGFIRKIIYEGVKWI